MKEPSSIGYVPDYSNYHQYILHFWETDNNDNALPFRENLNYYLLRRLKTISHIFQSTLDGNLIVISKNPFYSANFLRLVIQKEIPVTLPAHINIMIHKSLMMMEWIVNPIENVSFKNFSIA